MHRTGRLLRATALAGLSLSAVALVLVPLPSASGFYQDRSAAQEEPIPAFHTQPPKGELPETMSPFLFPDPVVENAYTVAAKIKKTLYQEPCYCHCDRSLGHTSLLDCFASRHGAGCNTCVYEDLYAYEQSRKGKTAAQIRAGIIKGEWQSVDVSKYDKLIRVE